MDIQRTEEMDYAKSEILEVFLKSHDEVFPEIAASIAANVGVSPALAGLLSRGYCLGLTVLDTMLLIKYEPELAEWVFRMLSEGVTTEEGDRGEAAAFGSHLAAIRSKYL